MGDGPIFLKTSEPLSLTNTYRMNIILAGSILLNSNFNTNFQTLPPGTGTVRFLPVQIFQISENVQRTTTIFTDISD
jgi:hypothetical protein